jgi:hypothetical protein
MPRSTRTFVALASGAAATLAAAAVAFAAPTVSTNRRCYVVHQTAQLTGAGFAPSTMFTVTVDGVFYGTDRTDSNGGFSLKLSPGGLPTGAAQHVEHVMVDDGTNTARTSFTLTRAPGARLTGTARTASGYTGSFQVWGFALDGTPRKLYLHYVSPSGHPQSTVALGQTTGACGYLLSKRRLFVPFSLSPGTWTLQVDTHRSYARHRDGPVARIGVVIG